MGPITVRTFLSELHSSKYSFINHEGHTSFLFLFIRDESVVCEWRVRAVSSVAIWKSLNQRVKRFQG